MPNHYTEEINAIDAVMKFANEIAAQKPVGLATRIVRAFRPQPAAEFNHGQYINLIKAKATLEYFDSRIVTR